MSQLSYVEAKNPRLVSFREGAKSAGISYARFRRAVRTLRIPIVRSGWGILVERSAIERITRAIGDGTIRRGRKKKGEV